MKTREERICDNIGLVHTCARRFDRRGLEYDDLFQAGCIGLVKAVDGFDEARGLKFSTYAVPVILGEIRRLFRDGGSVKVSRSLKELSLRATRERESFFARQGRHPTVGELAELLEVEKEQAAEALCASQPTVSLTRADDEEGGGELDIPVASPEEGIVDRLALRQVLSELSERERLIIVLRYFKRRTQQATAVELGMTQVQVSRKERAILQELRRRLTG